MILKKKHRYILAEGSRPFDCDSRTLEEEICKGLLSFMGAKSYSKASPRIVKTMGRDSFILRVARGSEREVILALAFIKELRGAKTGIYTLKTSGTIKSAESYYANAFNKNWA
ncbi:MAG: Rpp14/Pop5 family protein [Candidatus Micrarchaeaceae archaeon]